MATVTRLNSNSSSVVSTSSNTHDKPSSLDQKVATVAGSKLPCSAFLRPCLESYLGSSVSSEKIEDAANYLQNTTIPKGSEHYTIQKELLNWDKEKRTDFGVINHLHLAVLHCMHEASSSGIPPHQLSVEHHSNK